MTARTRAVIVVHLYGRPAATESLRDLGVPLVEDAAQAHGALRELSGITASYSFYPTKNLGGIGDGGAVITADPAVAESVRRLRVHGMTEQYVHVDISQNHRMSELEAAWLRLQLTALAPDNERRRAIARLYRSAAPQLAWQAPHEEHVVHLCVARLEDRERFRAVLADHGVATAVHYPLAITHQPAYRQFATVRCPHAEAWAAQCVTIPCAPELSDAEVEHVAAVLRRAPR
jgi:dTDP-4-amino-4,6-dideoxygalactose transaminase